MIIDNIFLPSLKYLKIVLPVLHVVIINQNDNKYTLFYKIIPNQ